MLKFDEIILDIFIEEIVRENVKEAERKDLVMVRSVYYVIFSLILLFVSIGVKFVFEILGLVIKDVEELEKNILR